MVGLTDPDGDFLSYSVDVVSLSLRKADGTLVQAPPTHQCVDFAGLVDLTELVTAASSYVIDLRPSNDVSARLGQMTVNTTAKPASRSTASNPWVQVLASMRTAGI